MEKIGSVLKERRQELGLSLEAMSEKTKLSIIQLEAIERGDIQFFADDLSYLSYFVRYYSNALDVDFNEVRDELDDSIMAYTSSINVSKIKQKEEMTKRVIHKTQESTRAKKRVDFSSVGLFALTALIILLLGFAIVKIVIPSLQSKVSNEPPVVEVPKDEDDETAGDPVDEETPAEEAPVESVLAVSEVDSLNYEISGWKPDEELTINLDFKNRAWVRFTEDGVALDVPAQGIYESDENAQVILKAEKDKVLTVNVGYFKGNVFSLNDEEIAINPDVAQSSSSHVVNFKLVEGESTE